MPATIVDLTCNHCGAPIEVSESVRFVTCGHCGSRLEIRREGGAAYTEVLERVDRLEEATDALGDDLERTRLELALSQLDDAWKNTLVERRWRGPQGQVMPPNAGRMRAGGILSGLAGLGLLAWCLALGIDVGGFGILLFTLIGLVTGGGFIWLGFWANRKGPGLVAEYEKLRAEYDQQRAELERSQR